MRIQILLGALVLGMLPLSQAQAGETTVIAVLGDSLTAGYGVKPEDAFPVQLEQKLNADGHPTKVLNYGISGDTTAGGVTRVRAVIDQHPDWIIIELGTNDMLKGWPPESTKKNLDAILRQCKQANIKILLTGIKASITLGGEYNDMFAALAKQYGVLLYPDFLEKVYGNGGLMQPDGIHPTSEGVAMIVSGIATVYERATIK